MKVCSTLKGPSPAAVFAATLTEYVVLANNDVNIVCVSVVLRNTATPPGYVSRTMKPVMSPFREAVGTGPQAAVKEVGEVPVRMMLLGGALGAAEKKCDEVMKYLYV